MPAFVFAYRQNPDYTRTPESGSAWMAWFAAMGDHVTDIGKPAAGSTPVGNCSPATRLGGYSLISAADLEEALALAKGCPSVDRGGGVEVAELGEVPDLAAGGRRAS